MRTHVFAAMTILAAVHLPACAGHTSDARRAEISDEISRYNQASSARAFSAALEARGGAAMSAKREILLVHDLENCLDKPPEDAAREVEIQRIGGKKLVAPCKPFAEAFRTGAAEAKTEDGKDVLVIRAQYNEVLASTAAGKLLVLRARVNVVDRRVVRVPGTCNRMPQAGSPTFMEVEHAFVLEGRRRDEVEFVDIVYDALDEDVRCDDYVY